MNEASVRVPATTANLGPGFDCLGIALQIYNTTTVFRGRGASPGEMATEAADRFFHRARCRSHLFHWSVTGDVPRSRGLGSSVTVRLGILHGLNELAGRPLGREALFEICAELEGHPDNAAPGAFGGFVVAPPVGAIQRFPVKKSLRFLLLIPAFEIATPAARKALPEKIPMADAVHSVGNAAALAAGFASGNYARLAGCFSDRLHQPYREQLLPCLTPVIDAAVAAGAIGGWLSGSGSTIACLATRSVKKIAGAMWEASGFEDATVLVVEADNSGVRILK